MNFSNPTRTCFICHDPDIWVNPRKDEIEPYLFVYDLSIPMPEEKVYSSSKDNGKVCSSEFIHTPEEIETILGGRD